MAEAASFGAALTGGIGIGLYPGWEMAEQLTPIVDEIQSNRALGPMYERQFAFFNRAYEAFVPLYAEAVHLTDPVPSISRVLFGLF